MEDKNGNNIPISKYIIDTVNLKFEKVYARFESIDHALALREENLHEDLMHLNELRSEVITDRNLLVRKTDYENLKERVKTIEVQRDNKTRNTNIALVLSFVAIILGLIDKFFK